MRAVRALVTASLSNGGVSSPDEPGPLLEALLREFGGPASVANLAVMADHLLGPLADAADDDEWSILGDCVAAVHADVAGVEGLEVLAGWPGPVTEFAALAHAGHALSVGSGFAWSETLFREWGAWAVVAGVRIVDELLVLSGAQQGATPQQALQALSVAHEARWGDGGQAATRQPIPQP